MSEESDTPVDAPAPDAEDVALALRRQINAVKAQMEAHREVMRAAGLVPPPPPTDPEAEEG